MSHVNSVSLVIKDMAALKAACEQLGLTFVEGQRNIAWYGTGLPTQGACEHAIKVPGARYEIGVYRGVTGNGTSASYVLGFDSYGSGGGPITKLLGKGLEKLNQAYAVAKATLEARARGWMVQKQTLPNGTVKLTMTGVS